MRHHTKWWVGLIGSVLILFGAVSCSDVPEGPRAEVRDIELNIHPGGAKIVTGSFVNISDARISVAQLNMTLFDGDNRAIDVLDI